MAEEYGIRATVNKGAALKGLFGLYKEAKLITVTIAFTRDEITIVEKTNLKDKISLLLAACLKDANMTYNYNFPEDEFTFCVDVKDFTGLMQNCNKNDALEMYVLLNDPTKLYMQFVSNKTSSQHQNLHIITSRQVEKHKYIENEYSISRTASVVSTEFEGVMKGMKKNRTNVMLLTCDKEGVLIERDKSDQGAMSAYRFGQVDTKGVPTNPLTFTIDSHGIAVLNKLSTLCDKADNILITAEDAKPLRITCNVGNFGKLQVYVFGPDVE
jgi:hypothetical protein